MITVIEKLDGFNLGLDYDEINHCFTIYSYQRIVLQPQSRQYISLPYKKLIHDDAKYINFEVDKSLCEKGLDCPWSNLNEDNSKNNLLFLFRNSNIILSNEINNLTNVLGSGKKIDIIPNTVLGKIFV
jgi:hypothetical protein